MRSLISTTVFTLIFGAILAQTKSANSLNELYNTKRNPVIKEEPKQQQSAQRSSSTQANGQAITASSEDIIPADQYYPGMLKDLLDEGVYVPENLANLPATEAKTNEEEITRLVYVPTWAEPYAMNHVTAVYIPSYFSWNDWFYGPYSRPFAWTYNGYRPWYSMWDPWLDPMPPYAWNMSFGWGGYYGWGMSFGWGGYPYNPYNPYNPYYPYGPGGYYPYHPYHPYHPHHPHHRPQPRQDIVYGRSGAHSSNSRVYSSRPTNNSRVYSEALNSSSSSSNRQPIRGTATSTNPVRNNQQSTNTQNSNRQYNNSVRQSSNNSSTNRSSSSFSNSSTSNPVRSSGTTRMTNTSTRRSR